MDFVQFDSVVNADRIPPRYEQLRTMNPEIRVLGGVGFKYVPETGNALEDDLRLGISRADAIVTTGDGTGMETPISKLEKYRALLGTFPLIVGAGINHINAYEQMMICDGAIIGSAFKPEGNTHLEVDSHLVEAVMAPILQARNDYESH